MKRFSFTTGLALVAALLAVNAIPAPAQKSAPSDDHIYDQVRLKLAGDVTVNGGALEVDVKDGVVTLRGKVRTQKAKDKAAKVAGKVKGVKRVVNELVIDVNAP
jgi:osmotically-inducible protein OsmY